MNTLKASYWTDQKTGEPIGPLYSWNEIREMQMDDDMKEMCRRKKLQYTDRPSAPTSDGTVVRSLMNE